MFMGSLSTCMLKIGMYSTLDAHLLTHILSTTYWEPRIMNQTKGALSSLRRKDAASHVIEMLLLYRSPIPVGRREVFYQFKWFLPAFTAPTGGGQYLVTGRQDFWLDHGPLPLCLFINPFLFIKNKQLLVSSEGFSVLEKNAVIRSQRVWQPSADTNDCLAHFFWICNCCVGRDRPLQIVMAVRHGSKLKENAPNGHYYLQRAITPSQITRQNCLQRAGGPKRQ